MHDSQQSPAEPNAPAGSAADATAKAPDQDEIFNFPCDFPIKVMGKTHADFARTVMDVVAAHDPTMDESRTEIRASNGGKYTGVTVHVTARDRAHLDGIYRALTGHPMVKVVL